MPNDFVDLEDWINQVVEEDKNPPKPQAPGKLGAEFLAVPFTILSARDGWWTSRKQKWKEFGIQSELGRNARAYNNGDWIREKISPNASYKDVSIFDPVLTEILVEWFVQPGGKVLDPFAGGSVRGVVTACTGRTYWGCDLREEQVEANRKQAVDLLDAGGAQPEWVVGDSKVKVADAPLCDGLLTCPPYGDLEVYSEDPLDLSTMDYPDFMASMEEIMAACFAKMKDNTFACFVVGDFRDKKGILRGFPSDLEKAATRVGFKYYNRIIYMNSTGSAALRASKQFRASRKLCSVHQDVLIFVKGDSREATRKLSSQFLDTPMSGSSIFDSADSDEGVE